MTLLEVTVAVAVFALATCGFVLAFAALNTRAGRVRCDTVACAILRAKVAKTLTDPWIPQKTPVDCVITSGFIPTTADPADPYDVGPTVTVLSSSDFPQIGVVTGTVYRSTYAFQSAAKTVVIDYQLTYSFRGKSYTCTASTIRASDK